MNDVITFPEGFDHTATKYKTLNDLDEAKADLDIVGAFQTITGLSVNMVTVGQTNYPTVMMGAEDGETALAVPENGRRTAYHIVCTCGEKLCSLQYAALYGLLGVLTWDTNALPKEIKNRISQSLHTLAQAKVQGKQDVVNAKSVDLFSLGSDATAEMMSDYVTIGTNGHLARNCMREALKQYKVTRTSELFYVEQTMDDTVLLNWNPITIPRPELKPAPVSIEEINRIAAERGVPAASLILDDDWNELPSH